MTHVLLCESKDSSEHDLQSYAHGFAVQFPGLVSWLISGRDSSYCGRDLVPYGVRMAMVYGVWFALFALVMSVVRVFGVECS